MIKKYIVKVNGQEYETEVEEIISSVKKDNLSNISIHKNVEPKKEFNVEEKGDNNSVVSPMPGSVLEIKCHKGDQVKAGDILFVLEAMKMENEILSPRDCLIEDILVTKDSSVNAGDILCSIK